MSKPIVILLIFIGLVIVGGGIFLAIGITQGADSPDSLPVQPPGVLAT